MTITQHPCEDWREIALDTLHIVLAPYRTEWVNLLSAMTCAEYVEGTFEISAPPYAKPEYIEDFSYLTAPRLLTDAFQLAIVFFHERGRHGGLPNFSFSEQDVLNYLKAGKLRISKVSELRFRDTILRDNERSTYTLLMRLVRALRSGDTIVFIIDFHTMCKAASFQLAVTVA